MTLLDKLVIFTVLEYLEIQTQSDTYQRDELVTLMSGLRAHRFSHKFQPSEVKRLNKAGEDEALQNLKEVQVDYSLYCIALITEWIKDIPKRDRPHINFSDKRILKLKANFVLDMLKMKQVDEEEHARVKEVSFGSQLTAKHFYHRAKDVLDA